MKTHLYFNEIGGIARVLEPVALGMPLPKGVLKDILNLGITAPGGEEIPFQAKSIAEWSDGSIKWALLDLQVSVDAGGGAVYEVAIGDPAPRHMSRNAISISHDKDRIIIDTGAAKFVLKPGLNSPIESIDINGEPILDTGNTKIALLGEKNEEMRAVFHSVSIETEGPLRVTAKADGHIAGRNGRRFADISSRITFFSGKGLCKMELTLNNPRAAKHSGGYWDLGDDGSVYFRDLSVFFGLKMDKKYSIEWRGGSNEQFNQSNCSCIEIYQDSSGSLNWNSPNHMDRNGNIMTTFRGYRVLADGKTLRESQRASPSIKIKDKGRCIFAAIRGFWQNFPKSIEAGEGMLIFRLFPKQSAGGFELQAGEQKTHAFFIDVCAKDNDTFDSALVHEPLIGSFSPEWYCSSGAADYLLPKDSDSDMVFEKLIAPAVDGDNTFSKRAEAIDEYGWRNFGDIYADHEIEHYSGSQLLISHYNNQYDVINGAIMQYFRSADPRWYQIAGDLAHHVIDIDIYHTDKDKSAYNGGMFWHTNHYKTAKTATHRCYSRIYGIGGGPSNEHNYTSGLQLYHYLTGDLQAKEAVLSLADWVINMDDGKRSRFALLDMGPTGLSSQTASELYHGPGRGAGNSINALIDAYTLTGNDKYIKEAEKLIKRCVNPYDEPDHYALGDPEKRWSYVIFFQVLGKYLDMKEGIGQKDYMYCYARKSLLKYADWMADNEYIYLDKPEKLEYPTETWAAQEMRKANVLLYAAKYRDSQPREKFIERAGYFYSASMDRLSKFATSAYVRPIAILLACGTMLRYFEEHGDNYAGQMPAHKNFEKPVLFMPQKMAAKRRLFAIMGALLFVLTAFVWMSLFNK